MNALTRFKLFLWFFGHFKVPLISCIGPKLIQVDEQKVIIKIPLRRRSKNHLNSMYFGALAIGADLAGGLHSFYFAKQKKINISVAFKAFQAQFLRRPENDVYFVCSMGNVVKAMVEESSNNGQRINNPIKVIAYINYFNQPEEVAHFTLELSVKAING